MISWFYSSLCQSWRDGPAGDLISPLPQQEAGQVEELPPLSDKEGSQGLVSRVSRMGEEAEEGRKEEWVGKSQEGHEKLLSDV